MRQDYGVFAPQESRDCGAPPIQSPRLPNQPVSDTKGKIMMKFLEGFAMRPVVAGLIFGLIVAAAPVAAQSHDGPSQTMAAGSSQEDTGRQDDAPEVERPDVVLIAAPPVPQIERERQPRDVVARKGFALPWQIGVFQ